MIRIGCRPRRKIGELGGYGFSKNMQACCAQEAEAGASSQPSRSRQMGEPRSAGRPWTSIVSFTPIGKP